MAAKRIRFRWAPAAIDFLLDLEDAGRQDTAQHVRTHTRERLGRDPGVYRFVRAVGLNPVSARRVERVQRLFLGSRLPFLIYYRYHKVDAVVEILHIRHARQKPIERG